jgi:hypothetical protein
MSDVGTKEKRQFSLEEKLETTYDRIKITSIFFAIGWILFCVGFIGVSYSGTGGLGILLGFVGMAIASGPMIIRMLAGGFKEAFVMPEYEVITTYADGHKESDHGFESQATNLIAQIILSIILVIVGVAVTIIYMIYLSIKYIVLFLMVKAKPSFIHSAFFMMIVFIMALIVGVFAGAFVQKAVKAPDRAEKARVEKEVSTLQIGQTITINGNNIGLFDGENWSRPFKWLNKGDIVTVKSLDANSSYIQIEHDGDIGFINPSSLLKKP